MRPKIVSRKAFAVMGVIGHFESASENFGPLWNEYMAVHDQIEPLSAGEGHYGIYLSADHSKSIDYLAGMAVRDAAAAPDGIKLRELPAALYAVFECAFQKIGPTYGYIWSVQRCDPAPDDQVVRDGLAFALEHAKNPPEWIDPQAKSGPAAWAYWAEALKKEKAKRDHHTYNAQLWLECREMAVAFLQEAKERLPGRCDELFDETAAYYAAVCEKLDALIALHPPREKPDWGPDSTFSSVEAAEIVHAAGEADDKGMATLQKIVAALN
ncbi:MAG: GyrI-like domain-containing protein [Anaerolineae bacterium]|nr:GyrI-like domain-containing protein [Anaerolineae bacterium]